MRLGDSWRILGRSTDPKEEAMSTTTAEHENTVVVGRLYDAVDRNEVEELARLISPDATMLMPGRSPLAGRYDGRDAIFGFFGKLAEASGGTYRAELLDLYAGDDQVVAVHHGTATRGDRILDAHAALVFEVADGVITAVTVHQRRQDEWDEFFNC
jgi:ketosteroid isomerase-like protein